MDAWGLKMGMKVSATKIVEVPQTVRGSARRWTGTMPPAPRPRRQTANLNRRVHPSTCSRGRACSNPSTLVSVAPFLLSGGRPAVHVLGVGYSHLAQILVVGQLHIRVRVRWSPVPPTLAGQSLGKSRLSLSHQTRTVGVARNRLIHLGRVKSGKARRLRCGVARVNARPEPNSGSPTRTQSVTVRVDREGHLAMASANLC